MLKIPSCTMFVIVLGVLFGLNGLAAAQDDAKGTLRGNEAIRELKQNGGYDSLMLAVKEARGDQEPIAPDATVAPWTKLNASDGAAGDLFGVSVAVSGDTAVVGAFTDDIGANTDQGSAYVFVRSGTTWTQQAQLIASDGSVGDRFGRSVAISGNTVIVGADGVDSSPNADNGAAYVFVRSGTSWIQQAKLLSSDAASSDNFGVSVAISDDTVIVGTPQEDAGGNTDNGAAYIFVRSGTAWTEQAKLLASDAASADYFGIRVGISGDSVIVGAYAADTTPTSNNGAAYVFVRNGIIWTQQAKLLASDRATDDYFGISVGISGDTAVVGADGEDTSPTTGNGAAYVFVRSGTNWTQQAKLLGSERASNDQFGVSVGISGDTLIVGAVRANTNNGAAYVFARSGTTWTLGSKLTASDGAASDFFGISVAVSGDTIFVGAHGDDVGANTDQGSVYAFHTLGNNWVQEAKRVLAAGTSFDYFGGSVSISGDTAVVGAFGRTDCLDNSMRGSVYVFVRSGVSWTQQAELVASDAPTDVSFGCSVSISGDTVVVGAAGDNNGANTDQGAAYIFVRSGTTWAQQAKLRASDGTANDEFGTSVAISGGTAIIGAYRDDVGANSDQGSAYVFVRSGTSWTQQVKLTASDGLANDIFGNSVAISGDTAVVGALFDDTVAFDQGSAYVFVRSGTSWSQQTKFVAADGAQQDSFGYSVAVSGDTAVIGAYTDDVGSNDNQGSANVYVRIGTTWSLQTKLTASDGLPQDRFGFSVAISDDAVVIGSYSDDIGGNIDHGSAYVFLRSGTSWTQSAKLTAPDGAAFDNFGSAVAISGNKIVVGSPGSDGSASFPVADKIADAIVPEATDQGSAYFFINVPASTNVSVSGRVLTSSGRGVTNAWVAISGPNNFTATVRSDRFGNFLLSNVPNGQTYTVTVSQRRFTFTPKVINIDDDVTGIEFVAGQ